MILYDYAAALALGSVAAEAEVETRRVDVGNRQPSRGGLLVRRSSAGEHAVRGSAERLRVAVDGGQPERPRIPDLLRPHADLALNGSPKHQKISLWGNPIAEVTWCGRSYLLRRLSRDQSVLL